MTEPTDYLQWSKTCPPDSYTMMQIIPDHDTGQPIILVECRGPTEAPPEPLINGKVVAGDIEWDVELGTWVLEDVRLEPIPSVSPISSEFQRALGARVPLDPPSSPFHPLPSRSSRLGGEPPMPKIRLDRVHQNLWTNAGQHIHRKPGDLNTLSGLLPTLDRQELRRAPALSSHLTHSGLTAVEGTLHATPPTAASPASARTPAASSPAPCLLRLVPRRRH